MIYLNRIFKFLKNKFIFHFHHCTLPLLNMHHHLFSNIYDVWGDNRFRIYFWRVQRTVSSLYISMQKHKKNNWNSSCKASECLEHKILKWNEKCSIWKFVGVKKNLHTHTHSFLNLKRKKKLQTEIGSALLFGF